MNNLPLVIAAISLVFCLFVVTLVFIFFSEQSAKADDLIEKYKEWDIKHIERMNREKPKQ
jgi:hypothetical protein